MYLHLFDVRHVLLIRHRKINEFTHETGTVSGVHEGAGVQMSDGWTVRTADGKYAAHYENTVLITAGDPELLTDPEGSLV